MLHIKIAQAIGYNAKWRATHTRCPFRFKTSLRAFRATWGSFIMSQSNRQTSKTSARRKAIKALVGVEKFSCNA